MTWNTTWSALALAASLAAAAPAAAVAAEEGEGPELGSVPPDFSLESVTDGSVHTLSEDRGERPVVLVFFRGAW